MTRFRVTYQLQGESLSEQLHLEVQGDISGCDDVLCALGAHLRPREPWPFVVATAPLAEDADLTERAVRLHRAKAACKYLDLVNVSYLIEGRPLEVFC
ncbi:MAG: hypothetical protein GAK35_04168 [Herbaspirillum frisingense]|uniref:Uncharacterized protein n=1 Tax=Herbaspirillum frisingense TaxID=92645 RepID=A0A7V8FSU6_9BURK|nr:MAG: hypothetical protein GAK35_04168 [Herbaspirillum frisingense]